MINTYIHACMYIWHTCVCVCACLMAKYTQTSDKGINFLLEGETLNLRKLAQGYRLREWQISWFGACHRASLSFSQPLWKMRMLTPITMNWWNVVHETFSGPGTKQWPSHGCWNEPGPTDRPVPSSLGVRAMLCHPMCHLGPAVKVPVCTTGMDCVWDSRSQNTACHLHHALTEPRRATPLP